MVSLVCTPANPPAPSTDAPRKGYKRASQRVELAGNWLPAHGPLHGLLIGAFEFKQKNGRGKGKLRVTYVVKLLDPCIASVKPSNGGYDEAELNAGELCGIFGGPGTRDLMQLYGCKVFIQRKPEKKELSNGNAMWEYDIDYDGKRRALPVRKWVESQETEPESDDLPDEDASFNPEDYENAF